MGVAEYAIATVPALITGTGLWWHLRYGAPGDSFFPILQYHKVDPRWEWGGTRSSPKSFARQMRYLHGLGYRTISLTEYIRHLSTNTKPPQKTFALTFDDAYAGLCDYALPLLAELGYMATIYPPSAYVGKTNDWELNFGTKFRHMTGSELRQAVEAGHEIGSHGRRHVSFVGLNDAELQDELVGSKRELEDIVGVAVETVSYPYGQVDSRVREGTRQAGYMGGCGSNPKRRNAIIDIYELRRLGVYLIDGKRTVAVKAKGEPLGVWAMLDMELRLINWFSVLGRAWRRVRGK